MKLNTRSCNIRMKLTPLGADFLQVRWKIGGDDHYFFPSSVMGGQFSLFLKAIYCLYDEEGFNHRRESYGLRSAQRTTTKTTAEFWWDEEGRIIVFRFQRDLATDLISVEIDSCRGQFHYLVAGTDLCYAAAKACTQTLKRYGFCGYGLDSGDYLDLDHFLFVKAHALGVDAARQVKPVWQAPNSWKGASGTDFEAELALLLFDM